MTDYNKDIVQQLTYLAMKNRDIAGTPPVLLEAIIGHVLEHLPELKFKGDEDSWKSMTIEQLVDSEDEWCLCEDGYFWPLQQCTGGEEGGWFSPPAIEEMEKSAEMAD